MTAPAVYSTGADSLDRVLGGGLPAASTTIVAGLPDTGKTILSEQFLFANATEQTPALYLTTLSEPLEKVVRYLQRFAFFDPGRLPGTIHYRDIGQTIWERGIAALPELVERLLLERERGLQVLYLSPLELDLVELFEQIRGRIETGQAARLVIDALGDMQEAAIKPGRFQAAVWNLIQYLRLQNVTGLFLAETGRRGAQSGERFAGDISSLADNILWLRYRRPPHNTHDRLIEIAKTRGSWHDSAARPFRIGSAGLTLDLEPTATG